MDIIFKQSVFGNIIFKYRVTVEIKFSNRIVLLVVKFVHINFFINKPTRRIFQLRWHTHCEHFTERLGLYNGDGLAFLKKLQWKIFIQNYSDM